MAGHTSLHIVDVAEFYAPLGGGVKTYIDAKLAYAQQAGVFVTIIAPGPSDRVEQRLGGQIIYVQAPAIPVDRRYHLFTRAGTIHRLLDDLRPDVVEASSPWRGAWIVAGWQGAVARRAHKALFLHTDAVAAHPQTWFQNLLSADSVDRLFFCYWRYLRRTARAFDTMIVGSRWFANRIRKYGGRKSTLVPLGVDKQLFHPRRRDPELRRRLLADLGLPPSARLLVGVGRHHPEKQWPTIFRGIGALRDEGVGMVQIGNGFATSAVERAAFEAGNVALLGHIADRERLAGIMASADALVHGSRAETFGLVVSEGLACGTPIILPSEGGCTDAADPAWSELYTAGDAMGVRDAVHRLLHRNAEELRVAAISARRTHISSADQHFERLFSLYASKSPPVLAPDLQSGPYAGALAAA